MLWFNVGRFFFNFMIVLFICFLVVIFFIAIYEARRKSYLDYIQRKGKYIYKPTQDFPKLDPSEFDDLIKKQLNKVYPIDKEEYKKFLEKFYPGSDALKNFEEHWEGINNNGSE